MFPVAYLHCERCEARRLFIACVEAPPIDENEAVCETCGWSPGYKLVDEIVIVGGAAKIETVPRPRIDPEVMRAGIEAYRTEYVERLRANGQTLERVRAQRELDKALANPDLAERRRITQPAARAGMDPDLAARVLQPAAPRNPQRPKPVE